MPSLVPPLWRHIAFNYRSGGLRQVVHKVFFRLRQFLVSDEEWLIYRIALPSGRASAGTGLQVELLTFKQLVTLKYFKAELFPEAIAERITRGARCFGIRIHGQLANVSWTTSGRLEVDGSLSIPCVDGAGIYDCFTAVEYRGRGIYPSSLRSLLEVLESEGFRQVLIAVDPGNIPSIKGIERAGFQPHFLLHRRRRLGFRFSDRRSFQSLLAPQGTTPENAL